MAEGALLNEDANDKNKGNLVVYRYYSGELTDYCLSFHCSSKYENVFGSSYLFVTKDNF